MRHDRRLPADPAADPADAAEQRRPADPAVDERELPAGLPSGVDADPADVLDQYRDAARDEEDER